jgi:hypothetical protein
MIFGHKFCFHFHDSNVSSVFTTVTHGQLVACLPACLPAYLPTYLYQQRRLQVKMTKKISLHDAKHNSEIQHGTEAASCTPSC